MSTRKEHTDALRTALTLPNRRLFTPSELEAIKEPGRPPNYVVFSVYRMYGGAEMNDGTPGSTMWRATTRAVAADDENAGTLLDECRTRLEGKSLTIGTGPSATLTGPIQFEDALDVRPDDGRYSGSIDWTYDHD